MMRILLGAGLAVLSAALFASGFLAAGAEAAPKEDNRNAEVIPVSCEGLGDFEVVTIDNAATAFGPDGQVFVALRITGSAEVTLSVEDGPTWTETDEVEEGAPGHGFEGRLVPCTFTETFHESFTLDEQTVEFLGLDPAFVGSTITIDGTFNGTAWVLAPGP